MKQGKKDFEEGKDTAAARAFEASLNSQDDSTGRSSPADPAQQAAAPGQQSQPPQETFAQAEPGPDYGRELPGGGPGAVPDVVPGTTASLSNPTTGPDYGRGTPPAPNTSSSPDLYNPTPGVTQGTSGDLSRLSAVAAVGDSGSTGLPVADPNATAISGAQSIESQALARLTSTSDPNSWGEQLGSGGKPTAQPSAPTQASSSSSTSTGTGAGTNSGYQQGNFGNSGQQQQSACNKGGGGGGGSGGSGSGMQMPMMPQSQSSSGTDPNTAAALQKLADQQQQLADQLAQLQQQKNQQQSNPPTTSSDLITTYDQKIHDLKVQFANHQLSSAQYIQALKDLATYAATDFNNAVSNASDSTTAQKLRDGLNTVLANIQDAGSEAKNTAVASNSTNPQT